MQVKGGRAYNPGWNLATDLPSMLTDLRSPWPRARSNRKESRGGHTREDYPGPDPEMGKVNFVQRQTGDHAAVPGADRHRARAAAGDAAELRSTVRGGNVADDRRRRPAPTRGRDDTLMSADDA